MEIDFSALKVLTKFEDCFKGAEIYCKQGLSTKLFKRLGNLEKTCKI